MATTTLKTRIRNAAKTEAQWSSANPVGYNGEIMLSTDKKKYKVGNGSSTWSQLSYNSAASVPEAELTWGGKNFTASFGCIDAAMIQELGANRFAGIDDGVTAEYTIDGGTTWTDYGITEDQVMSLFSVGDINIRISPSQSLTNLPTSDWQLRITIETNKASVYSVLNKFALFVATTGSSGCWCSIDVATNANPSTFVAIANKVTVSGWPGWNIVNTQSITTYGNNSAQYQYIRFTFGITSHTSTNYYGLEIKRIMAFGGFGWNTPSNLAKNGHLYSYDRYLNAAFPNNVKASSFTGNLTGLASKAAADASGNTITSSYAASLAVSGRTVTLKSKSGVTLSTITTQDTTYSSLKNPYALSINGKSYDGSAAITVGTLGVGYGGTGQTTLKAAANSFINALDTASDTPVDADYYVSQFVTGGTTTTTYHRRPMSALLSYVKGKLASVATSGSYNDLSNKPTSLKNPNALTVQFNGTTNTTYDGSAAKTVNITPSGIGAAASSHTHSYLPLSGGTVTGTLVLSKTTDLSGTSNNSPALIVGGAATSTHMELDCNEIQTKTNGTSVAPLYINSDGGLVTIGSGGLRVNGQTRIFSDSTDAYLHFDRNSIQAYNSNGTSAKLFINSDVEGGKIYFGYNESVIIDGDEGTIEASVFNGDLSGLASKATADELGNVIRENYAAALTLSNRSLKLMSESGEYLSTVTLPDDYNTLKSELYIEGRAVSHAAATHNYAVCNTAATTATKTVTLSGFYIYYGARIFIKFTYGSMASSVKITGLYTYGNDTVVRTIAVYDHGAALSRTLAVNGVYEFVYDGNYWQLVGDVGDVRVDGVKFNGNSSLIHYTTCSTAAATAEKTVSLSNFALVTGAVVIIKFTVTNTASEPTLNVNNTGAKAIYYHGSKITGSYLKANRVFAFVYDGSNYKVIGDIVA